MDRFQEETAADMARNYARAMEGPEYVDRTYHPDGYKCENCGNIVPSLSVVPEFEYLGCDDCMEEALQQIIREAKVAPVDMAAYRKMLTDGMRRPTVAELLKWEMAKW